jgi:ectoine hydroxylase-related dioxygenase (phytanoyl-CoA dioxygenase family)
MNRIDKESDVLYDLARHPTMIGIASELLGKPAVSLHVEYFAKPPHSLRSTPPHQDHVFYLEHFDDEMALSFWLALDDVTAASGALEYATPCARELLPHIPSSAPDFDFELPDVDGLEFAVAVVPRGGCVLHHSYVIHRSGGNRTERPRRALVFNYRGSPYRAWMRAEN